jgi:hypothetical protein
LHLSAYRDAQKGKKAAGSSSGGGYKSKTKEKATPTISIPGRSAMNCRPESRMDIDEEVASERPPMQLLMKRRMSKMHKRGKMKKQKKTKRLRTQTQLMTKINVKILCIWRSGTKGGGGSQQETSSRIIRRTTTG